MWELILGPLSGRRNTKGRGERKPDSAEGSRDEDTKDQNIV